MNLLIVGAGSFSTEIEELSNLLGYNHIAYLDDNPSKAKCFPVLGGMNDMGKFVDKYENAIVALGNNEDRIHYHRMLKQFGYIIPTLIHPSAFVSKNAKLGCGCIVRTHAVVSRNVVLGESCIVNVGALIDHDCIIGDGSHILMGAVIRNKIKLNELSWVESNSVRQ